MKTVFEDLGLFFVLSGETYLSIHFNLKSYYCGFSFHKGLSFPFTEAFLDLGCYFVVMGLIFHICNI